MGWNGGTGWRRKTGGLDVMSANGACDWTIARKTVDQRCEHVSFYAAPASPAHASAFLLLPLLSCLPSPPALALNTCAEGDLNR